MRTSEPVLVIIDVQEGLDDPHYGTRNNPDAEANMKRLLNAWRNQSWPIVHIQHLSTSPVSKLRPELPGCAIKEDVKPVNGERLFQKEAHSAFIGTGLNEYLVNKGYSELVLAGLTIEHCVSSTARNAHDLGFTVVVVADATAAFGASDHKGAYIDANIMHRAALASLNQEFARILDTEEVFAEIEKPILIA